MGAWRCAAVIAALLALQLVLSAVIGYVFGEAFLFCLSAAVFAWVAWVLFDCWWRSDLDDRTLASDLALLRSAFDVDETLASKETYTSEDVTQYYASTTDLDYMALELCVGPGLHSELRAPYPVLSYGGHTRQAVLVLMEVVASSALDWGVLFASQPNRRVLEVGFGRGYCTLFLAGLCPDVQFYGVDRVLRHLQVASEACIRGGYGNADFTCADATEFLASAPDCVHYDVIFGVEALCHLDTCDKLAAFVSSAAARLTHRGGRLVVVDGFRTDKFDAAADDRKTAMRLAECGFRIRRMPSKAEWTEEVRCLFMGSAAALS